MICYFSGTGNSRYVAERIAALTGDELISINDRIRGNDSSAVQGSDRLVFVTPTYAWRIPRVVREWIIRTDFPGAEKVWFVMTCGSEIGGAAEYNHKICEEKHWEEMGTAQILMPENFIAMFNALEQEEAEQIVAKAEPDIRKTGELIRQGLPLPKGRNHLYDRAMSSLINPIFYRLYVKADPFYAKDSCIGCGKCEKVCPLENIRLQDSRPVWGKNCTQCMACICYCPAEAIEYGKKSEGKPRYHWDQKGNVLRSSGCA